MKLEKEVYIGKINELSDMNICFNEPFTLKEIETLKKIAIKRKVKLTLEVLEEPIIGEEERKYLSGVISPFREKVINISKRNFHDNYFILISVNGKSKGSFSNHTLPIFDEQNSYIGMELDKEYTLKELGL